MISIVAKKREATEAIKTVIANYSNSDDCSYFRSQMGAVIASLKIQAPAVQQRTNPAEVGSRKIGTSSGSYCLDSVTSILQKFQNGNNAKVRMMEA